jgi:hypothetical protein
MPIAVRKMPAPAKNFVKSHGKIEVPFWALKVVVGS